MKIPFIGPVAFSLLIVLKATPTGEMVLSRRIATEVEWPVVVELATTAEPLVSTVFAVPRDDPGRPVAEEQLHWCQRSQ